jgi:hypothetical protein
MSESNRFRVKNNGQSGSPQMGSASRCPATNRRRIQLLMTFDRISRSAYRSGRTSRIATLRLGPRSCGLRSEAAYVSGRNPAGRARSGERRSQPTAAPRTNACLIPIVPAAPRLTASGRGEECRSFRQPAAALTAFPWLKHQAGQRMRTPTGGLRRLPVRGQALAGRQVCVSGRRDRDVCASGRDGRPLGIDGLAMSAGRPGRGRSGQIRAPDVLVSAFHLQRGI